MLDIRTHFVQRISRAPRRTFPSRMAAAAAVGLVAGTLAACSPLGESTDPKHQEA
ncbi:hypothetical protein JT358_10175 [Micrococcales bacterium 31B]|nr:hypothetical protein [Micrococcales bacterium 31B]